MNNYDLMTVFLEDTLFSDTDIVNNMIGFIFAATETTHFASQTATTHLTQSQESREKMRKEFKQVVTDPAIAEDPSLANLSKAAFLDKVVTLDASMELEFSTRVMQEAMRF